MRRRIRTGLLVDVSTQAQRIISLLSAIYEISYKVVRTYYYRYNEDLATTKYHLRRIYVTGLELSTIN